MHEYHKMLQYVLTHGQKRTNRTGVGTWAVFGYQFQHDLRKGFPLLTTKKMFWKGIVEELLWMLRGETNVKSLQEKGVHIWDEWADENGELGPVYGAQWRNWNGEIDQIANLIHEIRRNPDSRRLILNAWNVQDIPRMRLPPCHMMAQFNVRPTENGRELDCHMYQRSADAFLGVPFNIAQYALLTHILAKQTGLYEGKLIISYGDLHIYENHLDQVGRQLVRQPRNLPRVRIEETRPIERYTANDIVLCDYHPDPAIKGEVAV